MIFTTDQQTLEDLNIFGKNGRDSVYSLFNRTNTRGGAAILEELFRYPLSDAGKINERSSTIQYFASLGAIFPFRPELFDAAELYLANTDERTRLSPGERTLGKKITGLIAEDTGYKTIYKGVEALLEIMTGLHDLIKSLSDTGPYRTQKEEITRLLDSPAFSSFLQDIPPSKLPYTKVAACDEILRFRHRGIIKKVLQHIYYLDVYMSVARTALDRAFVFPVALPKSRHTVLLEGVYHPQLKNPVANTLRITPTSNIIFLTGANMAGKSTFMKSLGIALFLAHMGFPIPAARMEFSVRDGIYTTINLSDDLGMGASHFYAEVLRVKKVAQELSRSKDLFVIFDELFRGTNVKDAYEATIAITSAFAKKTNSMFVISTHIIEAGSILKEKCPTINFVFLPTRMKGNEPVYTYTLETGITADRHGMIIINNEGILDILQKGIKIAES
ncbi:MutS-related protein [Flavitalea flava]